MGEPKDFILKRATEMGLNMDKWKTALDNQTHKAEVEADTKAGNDAGISGTPAFVINGYFISGAQPYACQVRRRARVQSPDSGAAPEFCRIRG